MNSANGFADVAIHYYGTTHIYEIKPISHYKDIDKIGAGIIQMQGYVDAYQYFNPNRTVVPGEMQEEKKIYKEAQMAVVQSMLSDLSSVADVIEVPGSNWFSSIFMPEAILKAILEGDALMRIGSGGVCPAFS